MGLRTEAMIILFLLRIDKKGDLSNLVAALVSKLEIIHTFTEITEERINFREKHLNKPQ